MNIYSFENEKFLTSLKQNARRMKTTLFFLFFCFLFVHAEVGYSQSAKISLNMKSASIKDVCKTIERESGYIFAFSENVQNDVNKKIDIRHYIE